jgi:hypothetical protein
MIASRRIFIVSSSHPYHNCKIPFLYEHIMTPFMTPPAPTLLIPIIHLITRIYLAYRLCTNHVCPPFAFRIQSRSSRIGVTIARPRSPSFACDPFDKPKGLYHQNYFPPTQWVFRLHAVYHVLSESGLSYFVPIPPTLPWIFILFRRLDLFLILHSTLGCLGRSLW